MRPTTEDTHTFNRQHFNALQRINVQKARLETLKQLFIDTAGAPQVGDTVVCNGLIRKGAKMVVTSRTLILRDAWGKWEVSCEGEALNSDGSSNGDYCTHYFKVTTTD